MPGRLGSPLFDMRADIERDQTATTNAYGGPGVPSWASHLTDMPCRVWISRRTARRDDRTLVQVEETIMAFSQERDIAEGDRVAEVRDRRGTVLWSGPLKILTFVRRGRGHYEATLLLTEG